MFVPKCVGCDVKTLLIHSVQRYVHEEVVSWLDRCETRIKSVGELLIGDQA